MSACNNILRVSETPVYVMFRYLINCFISDQIIGANRYSCSKSLSVIMLKTSHIVAIFHIFSMSFSIIFVVVMPIFMYKTCTEWTQTLVIYIGWRYCPDFAPPPWPIFLPNSTVKRKLFFGHSFYRLAKYAKLCKICKFVQNVHFF